MLFNSIEFFLFFGFVIVIYWLVLTNKPTFQNLFLLLASLFFYSCWDYRFLGLLLFSIVIDYVSGIQILKSRSILKAKLWCYLTISINLGILIIFKYYDFFIDSFNQLLTSNNLLFQFDVLQIILPIGISFYTFHGISYLIDIKNNKIKPEFNFINYALFVSYFPLLVAGPIERATHLLPQLKKARIFNNKQIISGFRQVLWGLFKKVVIADTCAEFANEIFNNYGNYSSGFLIIGAVLFSIQIYGDFSGYTDIALGTSRVLGIELIKNFNFPYFSKSIHEFWKKWHISLTSWFRDYLYIPLGGSKVSTIISIRNIWIVFLISGLWHGANWTFIFWGGLNALIVTPRLLFPKLFNNEFNSKWWIDGIRVFFTFFLVTFLWVFFRSDSINDAINFLLKIFTQFNLKTFLFDILNFLKYQIGFYYSFLFVLFFIVEWIAYKNSKDYGLQIIVNYSLFLRWFIYLFLSIMVLVNMGGKVDFIYFQF